MNQAHSRPADAFAARNAPRIFCIGRNYAKHIEELGNTLSGKESIVFMKPASAKTAARRTCAPQRAIVFLDIGNLYCPVFRCSQT